MNWILTTVVWMSVLGFGSTRRQIIGKNSRPSRASMKTRSAAHLSAPESDQPVRFVGGNATSGIVQVNVRNQFDFVCGDGWGVKAAHVLCKQLGFVRGASSATSGDAGDGDASMVDVDCDGNEQTIQECRWSYPSDCSHGVAKATCKPNTGCPSDWLAGPTSCYTVPSRAVSRREHGVNKCVQRGGHLVTIDSADESHVISHLFFNLDYGPILTGGVRKDRHWTWETVEVKQDADSSTDRHTLREPIGDVSWFPGWQPGDVDSEPSKLKKERCLFLTNSFRHPNGTAVNFGYIYWYNDICKETRKRFRNGFRYMCERPRHVSQEEIGCYDGSGSDYRGLAAQTEKGTPCIKWTESPDINPDTYPDSGLGDHRYCRNPDKDERPWCWTTVVGNFGFCDIPACTPDGDNDQPPYKPDSTCKKDEFSCLDERCITGHWCCDMENDCAQGEDERGCDYKLSLFTNTHRRTVRRHEIEIFVETTNETCARACLSRERFICRSFSYSPRTRECLLSNETSRTAEFKVSRREELYELTSQLGDCEGMFRCQNGRCIPEDQVCDGTDHCRDFSDESECGTPAPLEVRLADGADHTGRVEVKYLGVWGVICDDGWDANDATVVCNMLGYHGNATAVGKSYFGAGNGDILLDDVDCGGDEGSLGECPHAGWRRHDCHGWEIAGVRCRPEQECDKPSEFPCSDNSACVPFSNVCNTNCDCADCSDEKNCGDAQVELVGGSNSDEGRIEVTINGVRGTICDDGFDQHAADVVCRGLGYRDAAEIGYYGEGSGVIWMDETSCHGNETNIWDCSSVGPDECDCKHVEDVGVKCTPVIPEVLVQLVDGASNQSGRVELSRDGIQGTICDDGWSDRNAEVICRMMGFSGGTAHSKAAFGPGDPGLHILLDDVSCAGDEDSIADCEHSDWLVHNCDHLEDAAVTCDVDESTSATKSSTTPSTLSSTSMTSPGPPPTTGHFPDTVPGIDCFTKTSTYIGMVSTTFSGHTCQHWSSDEPHRHKFHTDSQFPAGSVDLALNYCRDPDGTSDAPWCYTDDADVRWEFCNVTKCPLEASCYIKSAEYMGVASITEGGFICQDWSADFPHAHKYHADENFPDRSVTTAANYCRDPDRDGTPWCYTLDEDVRWEYCSVPKCKDDCYSPTTPYTGPASVTVSGRVCQSWYVDEPHAHDNHDDAFFPDGSVNGAANHCRAPDGDTRPWCFTVDPRVRWEHCDISECQGGHFNFTAPCGSRPREAGRYRRSVKYEESGSEDIDQWLYRRKGRIFGGREADYGMYPWQVGIRKKISSILNFHSHHCGATIIGEYWAVGAAHCFRELERGQIVIRTGDHNYRQTDDHEQEFDADQVFMHEKYDDNTFDYDLALLRLRPVNGHGIIFNDFVQPACLPLDGAEYTPGERCLVSGWGAHEDDTESVHLRAARVPLVDDRTCNRLYKDTITERMTCAGYIEGGIDSCTGDSGGPLVCLLKGKYTLMGVTSFGEGCADANAPGVYARVTAFLPWIREKLNTHG